MGTPTPPPPPTPPTPPAGREGDDAKSSRRKTFRRGQRLTHAREFQAVFADRMRKTGGPLAVFLRASDRPSPRLGLSIGRGVGGAVVRGRLKRMIREAFRLNQGSIPAREGGSYDVVVSARAHDPLTLGEYAGILVDLIGQAARDLARRKARRDGDPS